MLVINARFLTQNITGVQRFAIEIAKQLKILYGNDLIFVSPKNIIHKELAKELDVKIIGNFTGHLWEQISLPKYLKQNGNSLLLNLANTAPLLYANKIVTIHDLAFLHHPEWFSKKFTLVYNFLLPNIANHSKHILTVSQYVKDDISKSYKIEPNKIDIIYNSYSNMFKKLPFEKEDYVLAVGSIEPRKNLIALIDIFKKTDMKLLIVGQKNKVFSEFNLEKLPKNIIFTGYVDDKELVELYNKAKIFVYPSLFEGFGIPPLEAQACGTPVICSNVTSLPEVGGDSVLYCDPYDVNDIADKIMLLLEDKSLQNELIQKGYENLERFSWEKSAKKIIDIIEGII